MPDGRRPPILSATSLTPDQVARRTFTLSRRGYDTAEVRAFLDWVASGLEVIEAREAELRRMLEEAERRAANPPLDETTLTNALGQETARIIRTAHDAANEVTARAEENATRALNRAQEEASAIREKANALLEERREEAEAAAAEVSRAADTEASSTIEQARQEADTVLGRARDEGREMVREAQELRARILGDLARRRRLLHTQVEQLRAGKVSLAESVEAVRRAVDQVHEDLRRAEDDARAAADVAARRVAAEPELSGDDLSRSLGSPTGEARRLESAASVSGQAAPVPAATAPPPSATEPGPTAATPAAVPTSAPAAAEEAPAEAAPAEGGAEAEERRSGSLRLLRRPRSSGGPRDKVEEPLAAGDDVEGVRILGTQAPGAPSPAEAVGAEPEPGERVKDTGPAPRTVEADAEEAVNALFERIRASRPAQQPIGQAEQPATPPPSTSTLATPEATPSEPEMTTSETEAATGAAPMGEPSTANGTAPSADEEQLQRRDAAIEPIVATLARKLKRALGDEQNDTLDRLRSRRDRSATDAIAPVAEQERRISEVGVEFLEKAVVAGADFAGGAAKVKAKPRSEMANEEAAELARAIVGPLHGRIEEGLDELAAGDDAALVDHISACYREWKGQRIERLAGDYVAAAFARGALAATPAGSKLRWIVDDEGNRCPDCDDNALAGPVVKGDTYPTGQAYPPAHAGCRCLLVPSPA